MTRTLVIDYSTDRTAGADISRWIPPDALAGVFTPGSQGFPDPLDYTHVVHSGSALSICDDAPFQDEAENFIRRAVDGGVRQMGICYGHQLLARAVSGRSAVRRNPSGGETGWLEVLWSPFGSGLFGIPRSTRLFQFHYDEVVRLPEGAAILAWSPVSFIESFVSFDLGLFGVQFHPEFGREAGNALFLRERPKIESKGLDADLIVSGGPDPDTDGGFFRAFIGPLWNGR